jgi:hypothetical protein
MALAGEGAICIWNDILPERRDDFYAWHVNEHMPERVGIPGFRRGRRYLAVDAVTSPEFFTLYETETWEVTVGQDYLNRLNSPTPWTRAVTADFRNTARALTRVRLSEGRGPGGIMATLRFSVGDASALLASRTALDSIRAIADLPQITGVHLCVTDTAASAAGTAETKLRTGNLTAPEGCLLIEGSNEAPVRKALDAGQRALTAAGAADALGGVYRLEHMRLKTAWS